MSQSKYNYKMQIAQLLISKLYVLKISPTTREDASKKISVEIAKFKS